MQIVVDSNILIDYLLGIQEAKQELARYSAVTMSHMTWMEVMAGARPGEDARRTRAFLARYRVQPIDADVGERAVELRHERRVRLPDAIIWATAQRLGLLFVTRNTKDFPVDDPGIRVPYAR